MIEAIRRTGTVMAGCPRRAETYDQKTGRSRNICGSGRSPKESACSVMTAVSSSTQFYPAAPDDEAVYITRHRAHKSAIRLWRKKTAARKGKLAAGFDTVYIDSNRH